MHTKFCHVFSNVTEIHFHQSLFLALTLSFLMFCYCFTIFCPQKAEKQAGVKNPDSYSSVYESLCLSMDLGTLFSRASSSKGKRRERERDLASSLQGQTEVCLRVQWILTLVLSCWTLSQVQNSTCVWMCMFQVVAYPLYHNIYPFPVFQYFQCIYAFKYIYTHTCMIFLHIYNTYIQSYILYIIHIIFMCIVYSLDVFIELYKLYKKFTLRFNYLKCFILILHTHLNKR